MMLFVLSVVYEWSCGCCCGCCFFQQKIKVVNTYEFLNCCEDWLAVAHVSKFIVWVKDMRLWLESFLRFNGYYRKKNVIHNWLSSVKSFLLLIKLSYQPILPISSNVTKYRGSAALAVKALGYFSKSWGFKPQCCQTAIVWLLSKALNPCCSRATHYPSHHQVESSATLFTWVFKTHNLKFDDTITKSSLKYGPRCFVNNYIAFVIFGRYPYPE